MENTEQISIEDEDRGMEMAKELMELNERYKDVSKYQRFSMFKKKKELEGGKNEVNKTI